MTILIGHPGYALTPVSVRRVEMLRALGRKMRAARIRETTVSVSLEVLSDPSHGGALLAGYYGGEDDGL